MKNIKKATDQQIISAYVKAFKEKDKGIGYQFAFFVLREELHRRNIDFEKIEI